MDTNGLAIKPDGLRCGCEVDLAPFAADVARARVALDVHELVECRRQA